MSEIDLQDKILLIAKKTMIHLEGNGYFIDAGIRDWKSDYEPISENIYRWVTEDKGRKHQIFLAEIRAPKYWRLPCYLSIGIIAHNKQDVTVELQFRGGCGTKALDYNLNNLDVDFKRNLNDVDIRTWDEDARHTESNVNWPMYRWHLPVDYGEVFNHSQRVLDAIDQSRAPTN